MDHGVRTELEGLIANIPRDDLGVFRTPLMPAPRLAARHGLQGIFLKRDDLLPLGGGGNKLRKLEYITAAARAAGADTLVTVGAMQSNHCRLTAAAAAQSGMACHLVLVPMVEGQGPAYTASGNQLLYHRFGATVFVTKPGANIDAELDRACQLIEQVGGRPFRVPLGGSDATGTIGYINAALELIEQLAEQGVDRARIICASSSGGTAAGLLAGISLASKKHALRSYTVMRPASDLRSWLIELGQSALTRLGCEGRVNVDRLEVSAAGLGLGYGLVQSEVAETINLVASLEGVLLDPVYSGKAMHGFLSEIDNGALDKSIPTVLLHTGGTPALFAYPDLFT